MTTEDGALLSRAFADLPKRWRSVLWLLEVEGLATHEVAGAMGLSPNNVAQIAVRGRARLRERYLQAHVGANPAPACEFTTRRLGAHLNTTLSRRDVTKADQHLQVCTVCARRREDLLGLGLKMRTLLPVPLAVIPILRDRSRGRTGSPARPLVSAATTHQVPNPLMAVAPDVQSGVATLRAALEAGASQVMALSGASPAVQRLVGGATAALVAIGVSTIAVRTDVVGLGSSPANGTASAPATASSPATGLLPAATSVLPGGTGPGPARRYRARSVRRYRARSVQRYRGGADRRVRIRAVRRCLTWAFQWGRGGTGRRSQHRSFRGH